MSIETVFDCGDEEERVWVDKNGDLYCLTIDSDGGDGDGVYVEVSITPEDALMLSSSLLKSLVSNWPHLFPWQLSAPMVGASFEAMCE